MTVLLAISRDLPDMDQDDLPLLEALHAEGAEAALAVWNDPEVDWATARSVVVRSTWDYDERLERFLAWARAVEDAGTPLFNPAEVLRWNTHKSYLIELEERGAPVVPTAWTGQGDRIDLAELLTRRGWDRAVIKPVVGAGSRGLSMVDRATVELGQHHLDALLANGDAMIQPYLPSIETAGELSLVFIAGAYSHAIRKAPPAGEHRIQVEFGGVYEAVTPPADTIALAEWIIESTGHDLLYARVDLLEDDNGDPQLSELELTEPSLYLDHAEGAATRMARAILDRA